MQNFSISEKDFLSFKTLIYEESGICFNAVNRVILESKIESAMIKANIDNILDFYCFLSENRDSFFRFIDSITTNLTKFFRAKKHFEILQNKIIPKILLNRQASSCLKIWSAGCSTGEEAYSLAITCLETAGVNIENIQIFASDISLESLTGAKEGKYSAYKLAEVSPYYLSKYFDKEGGYYIVKDFLRKCIVFDYHNLKNTPPHRNIDIIFCRNVLIYFDIEFQKLTVNKFCDILTNDGYLFLGNSESLFGMDTRFNFNNIDGAIVYTKYLGD